MSTEEEILSIINSSFPGFKHIERKDKDRFDHYFSECKYPISEYTFSNLYMWRHSYDFWWNEIDDNLILISFVESPIVELFPPIGKDPIRAFKTILKFVDSKGIDVKIIRIPEKLKKQIIDAKIKVEFIEDRANWDYLYSKESLVNLSGGDYQNIRQKVNKFKRDYNWNFEFISKSNIQDCIDLHEWWCEERKCDEDSPLYMEKKGVEDLFQHWDCFDLTGGILRVDDKIVAYSLYEELCDDMLVCHVEKANSEYSGVYNAINQITLENIKKDYKYVNREQDLGIKGLRTAKMRYHPVDFVKKYIVER